ncbi:MAG: universal stress protein [Flavobacteriales bacterium]|nr:universal stress protein [Flavobacteriales bacterium]
MSNKKNRILVPTDFTKVVDYAMDHAVKVAEASNSDIHLLHILVHDEHADVTKKRMDMEVARLKDISGKVTVVPMARKGNVYDDIGSVAEEIGADLIIMGTHGLRGMQFLTGSRALRVITESQVPFVVVQEKKIGPDGYKHIVVPMDLQRETRQKVTEVADMAKTFNSTVHVISPKEKDEFLHRHLANNLQFARKYFGDRNIPCKTEVIDVSASKFHVGLLDYAKAINADLIAIMNEANESILGVFSVSFEQEIITNDAMIPVLVINEKNTTSGMAGWTFQ